MLCDTFGLQFGRNSQQDNNILQTLEMLYQQIRSNILS